MVAPPSTGHVVQVAPHTFRPSWNQLSISYPQWVNHRYELLLHCKSSERQGTVWGTTKTFVPANTALNQYSIPDLVLWLDASDIDGDSQADSVTSAVSISSWTDKSAKGIGVSQSNADLQPSQLGNQFGSKLTVRFDGLGDVLNLGSIRTSTGGYSAYALVKRESESGDDNAHLISESTWSLIPAHRKMHFLLRW